MGSCINKLYSKTNEVHSKTNDIQEEFICSLTHNNNLLTHTKYEIIRNFNIEEVMSYINKNHNNFDYKPIEINSNYNLIDIIDMNKHDINKILHNKPIFVIIQTLEIIDQIQETLSRLKDKKIHKEITKKYLCQSLNNIPVILIVSISRFYYPNEISLNLEYFEELCEQENRNFKNKKIIDYLILQGYIKKKSIDDFILQLQ
jgi:hypothetical protein